MTYAILGSGAIGTALARRFAAKGIEVSLANTKGPESLTDLVGELGFLVEPVRSAEALLPAVVSPAIPFDAVPDAVKGVEWGGRIAVDATNRSTFRPLRHVTSKAAYRRRSLPTPSPGARVVKAFNSLSAALLGADPAVPGGRRVLFVSGDDASARTAVVDLIEHLGLAAVDLGSLAEGGRAQQFGGGIAAKEFIQLG